MEANALLILKGQPALDWDIEYISEKSGATARRQAGAHSPEFAGQDWRLFEFDGIDQPTLDNIVERYDHDHIVALRNAERDYAALQEAGLEVTTTEVVGGQLSAITFVVPLTDEAIAKAAIIQSRHEASKGTGEDLVAIHGVDGTPHVLSYDDLMADVITPAMAALGHAEALVIAAKQQLRADLEA